MIEWMKILTRLFLWWRWQSSPPLCRDQTSSQPTQHSYRRCRPTREAAGRRRWVSSGPPRTTPGSALWSAWPRLLVGLHGRQWTLLRCRGEILEELWGDSFIARLSASQPIFHWGMWACVFFIPTPSILQLRLTASREASAHIFNMSCILASKVFGLDWVYFFTILPWTEREVVKGGGTEWWRGREKGRWFYSKIEAQM